MKKAILVLISAFVAAVAVQAQTFPHGQELPQLTKPEASEWKNIGFQAIWGDIFTRYPATYSPAGIKTNSSLTLRGWRGERVQAQALVSTGRKVEGLEYVVSDLKGRKGTIPSSAVEAGFVRYVMVDELNKDGKSGCSRRPDRTQYDSSMVADVIDPCFAPLDMEPMSSRGLWLTCWIPRGIPAGKYSGTVTFKENGKVLKVLKLSVEAQEDILPEPKDWRFHLDLWQNPFAVSRYYRVPLWSKEHFEAMRPLMTRLAEAGQKVVTASIIHKPWNGQTYDHFESMVTWMKRLDGSWEFRYDVFDAWVEFMASCGIDGQINCYSMVPWRLSFQYFDQASDSMKEIHAKPGEKEYEDLWVTFLKDFAAHLKAKGWFGKTTIAMDERDLTGMQATIAVVRKADPDFKLSLAGNYYPEIEKDLFDYCLSFKLEFPEEVLARRKAEGKFSTYYTCCAEPHPNTFTFSDPQEAFELGLEMYRRKSDGYLRWAYNSWPEDPLLDSRFRSWASGDTYLVYPGNKSSIRFELLVKGIQEYEKNYLTL